MLRPFDLIGRTFELQRVVFTCVSFPKDEHTIRVHLHEGGRQEMRVRTLLDGIDAGVIVESLDAPVVHEDRMLPSTLPRVFAPQHLRNVGSVGIMSSDRTRIITHAEIMRGSR